MDVPETPEGVALWLLLMIARLEGCDPERRSVEWVLETYRACLRTARGECCSPNVSSRLH